ncbi:MAG: imidazoleglycerol-phosphate dehydratase [Saccharolobus sp.]|uniref:imidazoleglycerol-phosphate dehydratase n=1 Tax=Saccharolobus sp. TaxID=2100761 RepID=UPI0028CD19C9|nr:imidazoleglycerol-phosphate dehydratase [Saccharolobus sp.]MDT7861005.1 imidazoleglycerol-phosphate dehydratase [Saccharolobus sp.]
MTRFSNKVRETKETKVEVYIDIDKKGEVKVSTPIPFFNHMLTTLLTYMNCSAVINAIDKQSYDDHHIVEDVAIVLGKALEEALGDKRGIKRFSHFIVPMDDALILTSIDISSRGMAFINLNLKREEIGGMATENVFHFFQSFAYNSGITVHILQLNGFNTHHIIEASFKALGMALYDATRIIDNEIRSTKGMI